MPPSWASTDHMRAVARAASAPRRRAGRACPYAGAAGEPGCCQAVWAPYGGRGASWGGVDRHAAAGTDRACCRRAGPGAASDCCRSWRRPSGARSPSLGAPGQSLGVGDEVDELLDAGQQRRLEVGVGAHRAEDPLPRARDVGLGPVRPAQLGDRCRASTTCPRGMTGHVRQPEPLGAHRLPHVDVRVARGSCTWARSGRRGGPRPPSGSPWCPARGGRRARPSGGPGRAEVRGSPRPGRRRRRASRPPRPRCAGRRPRPSRPARRRGGPRRRSATRGRRGPGPLRRRATRSPYGRRRPWPPAGRRGRPPVGGVSTHRGAVEQEARDRSGTPWCGRAGPPGGPPARRRPSRRAPRRRTHPVSTSSTTRPVSASTSRARPPRGARQSPDRTSAP